MRGIISWIIFFSAGVICAGSYFYRLHPEHEPEADLPRARNEVDELVERGKRLKRAWDGDSHDSQAQDAPAPQQPPAAPPVTPARNQPGSADRPPKQSRVGK